MRAAFSLLTSAMSSWVHVIDGGLHRCPSCSSSCTRPNPSSSGVGARLCDACGCRWRR